MFIIEVNCCYFAIVRLYYTLWFSVEPHCIGMYPDVFPRVPTSRGSAVQRIDDNFEGVRAPD